MRVGKVKRMLEEGLKGVKCLGRIKRVTGHKTKFNRFGLEVKNCR
jgi:hypothetical protein